MFYKPLLKFNNLHQNNLNNMLRKYATLFTKELDIPLFGTLTINCPYNINVKPIDVFKTQEKVVINVSSKNNSNLPEIKYKQSDDVVHVSVGAALNETSENYTLNVETSTKANLNIYGNNNNIEIGSFYGDFIDVTSNKGDINLSKSQCKKISLVTSDGNIVCKDVVQAGDIILRNEGSGNIITDRIQGIKLNVVTKQGHMNIGSSFCDNSIFKTDSGHLTLQNLHRNVTIKINSEGLLNIVGFDGTLNAFIKKGLADLQIAKLYKDSQVIFENPSTLILRLSEECQKENLIDILTRNYVVSDTVKMNCAQKDDSCQLSPLNSNEIIGYLRVKCQNSSVLIDSASWSELFKASIKKRT